MLELNKKTLLGAIFIVIGIMLFIRELGWISEDNIFFNLRTFPIYAGIIFLLGKQYKIAIILFCVSVVLWFNKIAVYIGDYYNFIFPLLFIIIGFLLVVGRQVKKKSN